MKLQLNYFEKFRKTDSTRKRNSVRWNVLKSRKTIAIKII